MTDDRNQTSHTYHEEVAQEIYTKIGDYYKLWIQFVGKLSEMPGLINQILQLIFRTKL